MARIQLKVVVDAEHLDEIDVMKRSCEALGLDVETVIPEAGAIFGSADESVIEGVSRIEGVEEVRAEPVIQVPPLSEEVPL